MDPVLYGHLLVAIFFFNIRNQQIRLRQPTTAASGKFSWITMLEEETEKKSTDPQALAND
jgi:hypothetical protein